MDKQSKQNPPRRYPRPRRKEVRAAWGRIQPRNDVPDAALWLAEDAQTLDLVVRLLKKVNPLHIGNVATQTQRDASSRRIRTTIAVIKGWQATARGRLRSEYLAP